MGDNDVEDIEKLDHEEAAKWDPSFTEQVKNVVGPLIKRYFRAEVRGMDAMPAAGGALVVSNHSGGMMTPDVLVFAPEFYDRFGYDRPLYTLGHYGIFIGPLSGWLRRAGVIEASRENAAKALRSGAVVLVFPGGDYDSYRSDILGEQDRLRWADRIRQDRDRDRCTDRAGGVDRCTGDAAVPHPRQLVAKRLGLQRARAGDPAGHLRIPVRAQRVHARQTCPSRPRSSRRCWSRSMS